MQAIGVTNLMQVLLIEDNPADRALIQKFLQSNQIQTFDLKSAAKLEEGLILLSSFKFDIIILDLSLPDSQGLDSLRTVLNTAQKTPVVVMTGFADEKTGVEAIRIGAQDYLMKSQTSSELLVRSLLFAIERKEKQQELAQSQSGSNTTILKSGDLEVDLEKQLIIFNEFGSRTPLSLTPLEFKIFVFLFKNQKQTVSRGQIVAEVWGMGSSDFSSRTVDKHISALKKKSPKIDALIGAVYGVGYRFEIV